MVCAGYTKVWDLVVRRARPAGRRARDDAARHARHAVDHARERHARHRARRPATSFTIDRGGLTLVEAQGRASGVRDGAPRRRSSPSGSRQPASHGAGVASWLRVGGRHRIDIGGYVALLLSAIGSRRAVDQPRRPRRTRSINPSRT